MKHSAILFLVAGLLFIPGIFGTSSSVINCEMTTIQSSNTIDLRGHFTKGETRRSTTAPITAEQQTITLVVTFAQDLEVLHVTITGTQGRVYDALVDTSEPSNLLIPLVNLPSGSYTIVFNNEYGTMEGNFII